MTVERRPPRAGRGPPTASLARRTRTRDPARCEALVIEDERPRAFCAGLLRPRVYVSTGALALLDESALGAGPRARAPPRPPARSPAPGRRTGAGAVTLLRPGPRRAGPPPAGAGRVERRRARDPAAPGNRAALARAMLTFAERSRPDDPTGRRSRADRSPARGATELALPARCSACFAVRDRAARRGRRPGRADRGRLEPPWLLRSFPGSPASSSWPPSPLSSGWSCSGSAGGAAAGHDRAS